MADKESLDNLIEGMAGAVVEAQQRIETHQITNFLNFFDEDNRPKKLDVLLPSLNPAAEKADVLYRVPLLSLVASSLLRIKEVEISFDTDLIGVTEQDSDKYDETNSQLEAKIETPKKLRSVSLDMRGSGIFRKKTGTVHVVMKVEGRDISESMARLVDRLIQVQGDIE